MFAVTYYFDGPLYIPLSNGISDHRSVKRGSEVRHAILQDVYAVPGED